MFVRFNLNRTTEYYKVYLWRLNTCRYNTEVNRIIRFSLRVLNHFWIVSEI